MLSRRSVIQAGAVLPLLLKASVSAAATPPEGALTSLTLSARPIGLEERRARIAKLQDLLARAKLGALLIEPGSSLEYFTGIDWRRSERTTAAIIPAHGQVYVVTPAFEEPSVRETLQVGGDVRAWDEHESPFERLVQCLRDAGVNGGSIAVESTTRYFIIAGIQQVSSAYQTVPADSIVRACRLIKSPAELELMRIANAVTLAALRHVHANTAKGMTGGDFSVLVNKATAALGGTPEFGLALLNEASAFPHGSIKPQTVREGSTVLMDCGCTVHGYQSDISRTWVFGEPSPRQRKVWATIKRGQELALETARPGIAVGTIDDTVRKYYESEGWGPGYRLPGLPHRTGHGIGLDGHEPPYLVHGDSTPLQVGMCFSDEPGIYIPGEFGMRLEDCWHMTDSGAKSFTPTRSFTGQAVLAMVLALLALAVWVYLVTAHGRFWSSLPQLSRVPPAEGALVDVIVPARDESETIEAAVASLRSQDYLGGFRVTLVDDNSSDDTAARAARNGGIDVLRLTDKPAGWSGKLWALSRGVAATRAPLILFSDADIVHEPGHLSALVTKLESASLDMVSEMVGLHCDSLAEKALIPAFVYFFQMLYPFSRVNSRRSRVAAAAGGTV